MMCLDFIGMIYFNNLVDYRLNVELKSSCFFGNE